MIMRIKKVIKKHEFIKEIKYNKDKSISINYIHQSKFKPKYLVNDNHIFYNNGFRTVLTSDTLNESLNPLDINSLYPVEKYQTAIESKVIKDVFSNLKTEKFDMVKMLLFANILIGMVILYYIFMGGAN